MADLRVKVAGVSFKNPVIPASGAFGFGREYEKLYPLSRLGGISCKGTTLNLKDGNPPPRIAENSVWYAQFGWFAESWYRSFY